MDPSLILKCINDAAQVLRSEIQQQHIVHTIEMRKMQERIKQLEVWGPITNEIRSNACLLFACNEITSQTSTDYEYYLTGDDKYVKLPLDFVYTGDATKAVYYLVDQSDWDHVVATRISEFDARPPAFAASDYDDKITMTKEEMALDDFGGNRLDKVKSYSENADEWFVDLKALADGAYERNKPDIERGFRLVHSLISAVAPPVIVNEEKTN